MAGTATHLAVADYICEKLGNDKFKSLPLFYSGNIAPDAIHARANYVRAFKKHTHLTEGISGGDFQNPEKVAIFHERLIDYISTYYDSTSDESDLYLGYITHLVTDEYFNIHIRQQFVAAMEKEGIQQEDVEFFKRIMKDIDSIDAVILKKYPFKNDVRAMLDGVWGYEIKDMVTADEISRSKRWVVDKLFDSQNSSSNAIYYCYEEAEKFIVETAEKIINRFSIGANFPKLL